MYPSKPGYRNSQQMLSVYHVLMYFDCLHVYCNYMDPDQTVP